MHLIGLGTALPPRRYTQEECWSALQAAPQFPALTDRSRALLRKVLGGRNGITSRHVAISDWTEAFDLTPDSLHARFARHAPALGTQAAVRALAAARITPAEIDAVIVSTCTGYLCPGLTSHLSERLGLRADVLALDLVGQGCGAALPNLRTGEALLSSGRAGKVLSVCVEICSAACYLDDDPEVLISACLFGDGAAAAVLSPGPSGQGRRVEWKSGASLLSPGKRDELRFEQRGGMLRNRLARQVPALAAGHAAELLAEMVSEGAPDRAAVSGWVLHAGGREVLDALRGRLALSEADVAFSTALLREIGNVSSPFVLFVLERALASDAPGGWWWMSSFGAGFSCHGAFLRVD